MSSHINELTCRKDVRLNSEGVQYVRAPLGAMVTLVYSLATSVLVIEASPSKTLLIPDMVSIFSTPTRSMITIGVKDTMDVPNRAMVIYVIQTPSKHSSALKLLGSSSKQRAKVQMRYQGDQVRRLPETLPGS